MERRVPSKIIKQLSRWSFQCRVLRIAHFILVLTATVSSILVAAKLSTFPQGVTESLAVLAAVSVSLIQAFDLGSKANRMRGAWRKLNAAVILFEEDPQITIRHLVKAYERGEELIGDVKEEP